jgi:death-on-curing protein
MCLSAATIINFNKKTVQKSGEEFSILHRSSIDGLSAQVDLDSDYAGYDSVERVCLAAYQLAKGHYFIEGNKRTAMLVLLNCLRKEGLSYTGRPKDLAVKIVSITQTNPADKRAAILELAYFLKHRI